MDWRLWRRDSNGYWYAVPSAALRKRGARRKSLGTKDRAEAHRRLLDAVETPAGTITGEIVAAYIEERRHTATAFDRIEYAWARSKSHFSKLRPDQITRATCRVYLDERRKQGAADGTIRRELEVVRTALRWGNKHHEANFELPPSGPPRERWLTKEEIERLIENAQAPHVKLFIELAYRTGARSAAVLALTWNRVDLSSKRIRLDAIDRDKRRKGRATVPINERLGIVLKDAQQAATCDHVIEYGGRPVKSIKRGFKAACKRAGIEGVTPHTLRHSAATHMAMASVPMPEIAAFLGHSDSRTTERVYAKFSPEYLQKAARALE